MGDLVCRVCGKEFKIDSGHVHVQCEGPRELKCNCCGRVFSFPGGDSDG